MQTIIEPFPCKAGSCLPLTPALLPDAHRLLDGRPPEGTGWSLCDPDSLEAVFTVASHAWLPESSPMLLARKDINYSAPLTLQKRKPGQAIAVITLSDKGAQGLRNDTAGPLAAKMISDAVTVTWSRNFLLPDNVQMLRGLMEELALTQKYDLICTSGGTGLAPADITPQATLKLLDYELPGFSEAMRAASIAHTPNAIISRAVCGVIGQCLVINLPGSSRAVAENLQAVLPGLAHALAKLQGDPADCGAQA